MNSTGFTAFTPLDADLSEAFETNDLVEGDFGMGFAFDDAFLSLESAFCFFVGESLLLNVNVLLRGRSRLVEPDLSVCDAMGSSSTGPSRDLENRVSPGFEVGRPSLSPIEECADGALEA